MKDLPQLRETVPSLHRALDSLSKEIEEATPGSAQWKSKKADYREVVAQLMSIVEAVQAQGEELTPDEAWIMEYIAPYRDHVKHERQEGLAGYLKQLEFVCLVRILQVKKGGTRVKALPLEWLKGQVPCEELDIDVDVMYLPEEWFKKGEECIVCLSVLEGNRYFCCGHRGRMPVVTERGRRWVHFMDFDEDFDLTLKGLSHDVVPFEGGSAARLGYDELARFVRTDGGE